MRIFKFGGASVKNAAAVRNVAEIVNNFQDEPLIIVVSAMGKTTNALEAIITEFSENNSEAANTKINALCDFHLAIIEDLFQTEKSPIGGEIKTIFDQLKSYCSADFSGNYHFEYDQIISYGEIVSTKIIHAFLLHKGFATQWTDARKVIRTNSKWREASINWEVTEILIKNAIEKNEKAGSRLTVTQGFLGHDTDGYTTTLGREGSDFTAAIFAYCLEAGDVTIWKDVPGMLNADPKYFDNTVLLDKISFREAIELAYFGASVIHPKTIQPLKRKGIPLYIKSFIHPDEKGSVIQESIDHDHEIPSFIFKMNQLLISLTPKDFSFIVEENLEHIFGYLNKEKIRVNLMQNSAVSFSFVVDKSKVKLEELIAFFKENYLVKYNEGLELVTIRHYDDPTLKRVTTGKKVILEQKSRQTARLVII